MRQTADIVFIDLERRVVEHTLPPLVVIGESGPVTIALRTPALSPDGSLLYVSSSSGTGIVDVRSRSYVGRVNVTAANAELPPVFNLTGNRAYVVERRTAVENNQLFTRVWLVEIDTATAAEVNRIPLPDNFDPDDIRLSLDGLLLTTYGFVRPLAGQPKVILILIDVTAQRVASIIDAEVPDRVGKIGISSVQ